MRYLTPTIESSDIVQFPLTRYSVRMTSGVRVWTARGIAAFVDLLQIGLFPFFIEGSANPLNAILDVLTCITLICLIGWHIAFLPTFIIEQLPVADLAPT